MRILVVDDTPDAREVISAMAEALGHEVIQAHNGMEAVKAAVANSPELVLMDLMMPEVDGAQASAALRNISTCVDLPIVLVTAFPQEVDTGMHHWDAFLKKPFSVGDLERVIEQFAR